MKEISFVATLPTQDLCGTEFLFEAPAGDGYEGADFQRRQEAVGQNEAVVAAILTPRYFHTKYLTGSYVL